MQDLTVNLNLKRGTFRLTGSLYLGGEYLLQFNPAGAEYSVILTDPEADSQHQTPVVYAQSKNDNTMALTRQSLLDAFKRAQANHPDGILFAKVFIQDASGRTVADGSVSIEYSPADFVVDTEDYPLAREILLQAAGARDDAITAKDHAIYAKSHAEVAQWRAEAARDEARSARDVAQEAKTRAEEAATTSSTAKQDAITAKNAAQNAQRSAEESASTTEAALEKMIARAKKVVGGVEVLLWNGQGDRPGPIFIPNGIDGVTGYVKCDEDGKYYFLKCKKVDGENVLVLEQVGVDNVYREGYVRAVNGMTPDETGNVLIPDMTGGSMKGPISFSNETGKICSENDDGRILITGGNDESVGAAIFIMHKDFPGNYKGGVWIRTVDQGGESKDLLLLPSGVCKWDGKDIVRSVNGSIADQAGNVEIPLDFLPLAGGTITGPLTMNDHITTTAYEFVLSSDDDTKSARITGGTGWDTGASLIVRGSGNQFEPGYFIIRAVDSKYKKGCMLVGRPDGTLTWGGKAVTLNGDCLPLTGGKMTGTIRSSQEGILVGDTDASSVRISGGTSWDNGGSVVVYGKSHSSNPGKFRLKADDGSKESLLEGSPDGTLTWGGKAVERVQDSSFNGSEFYIKYASGLLVQGGRISVTKDRWGKYTIQFNAKFINTNYKVTLSPLYGDHNQDYADNYNYAHVHGLAELQQRRQKEYAQILCNGPGVMYVEWNAIGRWK